MTWLLAITTMSAFAQQATVTGPDSFLKVNVSVKQGIPIYSVTYKDKTILEDSPLGFVANVGDFSRDMTFTGQKENKIIRPIHKTVSNNHKFIIKPMNLHAPLPIKKRKI